MKLNEFVLESYTEKVGSFSIAADEEGHKCVLLRSKADGLTQRLKTDHMALKTNVEMVDEKQEAIGVFHVIQCLSQDIELNNQFKHVCTYMFSSINEPVSSTFVTELFLDIQRLFETTADPHYHDLQIGVYGEMVLIDYLRENGRNDIAEKWHSDFYSKHDMEIDSHHRIEIKTTGNEKRVHSFRHNQLVQHGIEIVVVSVRVFECEQGTSLLTLMRKVQAGFASIEKKLLIEKLMKRCKLSEEDQGIVCNLRQCYDEIKIYKAENVPHITEMIPVGVTGLTYDVNLDSSIPMVAIEELWR